MALFDRFCGELPKQDAQAEVLRRELGKTLTREQRKMLLKLVDLDLAFCESSALSGFIIGFRVASGIAAELKEDRYSYEEEQERRAEKYSDKTAERDT